MKKLVCLLAVLLAFSTTATAIDIGCSTQVSWWGEAGQNELFES